DACSFYSETAFRELIGQDGEFFSQSADAAYRRLADGTSAAPDFSGCWWRLGFAEDAFIMMQLQLYPVSGDEAKSRVDTQLEAARKMKSPLLPEELGGFGDAALWSRLSASVRWRYGDVVLFELIISEQVADAKPLLDNEQRKQLSIRAARAIDPAIRHAYPSALTHP
ncbi:hypothetical protein, partial [Solemya elarraichensis gill symbiont]